MGRNVFLLFANFLFMIALTFFFLRDGVKIWSYLRDVVPMEKEPKKLVFDGIATAFSAVIRGQFLSSLAGTLDPREHFEDHDCSTALHAWLVSGGLRVSCFWTHLNTPSTGAAVDPTVTSPAHLPGPAPGRRP